MILLKYLSPATENPPPCRLTSDGSLGRFGTAGADDASRRVFFSLSSERTMRTFQRPRNRPTKPGQMRHLAAECFSADGTIFCELLPSAIRGQGILEKSLNDGAAETIYS